MTVPSWLPTTVKVAAAGSAGRLSVLIFHRVHSVPDPLFPGELDRGRFEGCMDAVRECFAPMPLIEACAALDSGRLPPRAIAITFDDGYADNFNVALPILKRLEIPATFFVASDYLDGGRMWNDSVIEAVRQCRSAELDLTQLSLGRHSLNDGPDRRAAIRSIIDDLKYLEPVERSTRAEAVAAAAGAAPPRDLMMTSEQLRELVAAGMSVGAHTRSHPILARISEAEARREIAEGRDRLAGIIRAPVDLFAYPNGKPGRDYSRAHVDLVRDLGFSAAVSTARGVAAPGCDRWQIPRFTPWNTKLGRFALQLAVSRRRLDYEVV